MCSRIDDEPLREFDTLFFQNYYLLFQSIRVYNHSTPDHTNGIIVEDSCRNKVQYVFFRPNLYCMAGIITTLKSYYSIDIPGQNIDYFCFSLVTKKTTYNSC